MTTTKISPLKLNIGPRPICKVCNSRERVIGQKRLDGTYGFQPMCSPCKLAHLKKQNGCEYIEKIAANYGFATVEEYNEDKKRRQEIAKAAGFSSIVEHELHCTEQDAVAAGFENVKHYRNHRLALSKGFKSFIDYLNSKHRYRQFRKDYCENIDGRLDGNPCTTTIILLAQLDVDHIDGNPDNNDESNLQTLCKCCHTYKTLTNKDYSTPGRRKLRIKN